MSFTRFSIITECGRTFQEPTGDIVSIEKTMNETYSKPLNCEWRITATQGEKIQLKITEFDLVEESNCENNYLEIRDGYWIKDKLIGRYCAKDIIPETLMSTGYRLLLTYHTSGDHEHKGFKANYEAICGGDLSVEDAVLHSPNYPDDYRPNKDCTWIIKTKPNYQIALKFISFELENHESCVYDYLEIRDGNSENSSFLGKLCGPKLPAELHSTGNELWIRFVSDSTVQKAGFSLAFNKEFDECAEQNHGCQHICVNTLGGYRCECRIGFELHSNGKECEAACGGLIDSVENGTLLSPSFPDLYPPNKRCVWQIIAPPLYRIYLNFTRFDLEGNNLDCGYDSVEVRSKLAVNEYRNHGLFCGSRIPQPITSVGNQMRIDFTTDNSVQKTGFSANFFTDLDECSTNNGGCQHICKNTIGSYKCSCQNGFVLHTDGHSCKEGKCIHTLESQSGELSTPNYPNLYSPRQSCIWSITTTSGHRVKIHFHQFELEIHPECFYDHLTIYDGDSNKSRQIGRFCGNKIPNPLIASANSMYLIFKSDATVQRKGFSGVYSTGRFW